VDEDGMIGGCQVGTTRTLVSHVEQQHSRLPRLQRFLLEAVKRVDLTGGTATGQYTSLRNVSVHITATGQYTSLRNVSVHFAVQTQCGLGSYSAVRFRQLQCSAHLRVDAALELQSLDLGSI
jgi:hypothetical protein